MRTDFDIAIVGSGFSGSLLAMIARRLGRSVILLERGRHPRFAIGESSTPLANQLWEEMAVRYDLPRLRPLAKWGSWQRHYPQIGCGLKRGFTFYHQAFGRAFAADPQHGDQLLIAASPGNESADTHWYRPDFDHFLVREAQALGVEYVDETTLAAPQLSEDGATLTARRRNGEFNVRARLLFDASGPRGYLHRAKRLPEIPLTPMPSTQALYSHFSGVGKMVDVLAAAGGVVEGTPYPVDDAALHHVFPGGWIWVLPFNNGLTSAGVAATDALANELRLTEGQAAWTRLLAQLPTVQAQFVRAQARLPFTHVPRLSFCSGEMAGSCWALLPSAAGFVDPLLSTGFALTLFGVLRLANLLATEADAGSLAAGLAAYARQTQRELQATAKLIAALYASMGDFEVFATLSLLYFVAASFSEIVRRLGRPERASSFLLAGHPEYASLLERYCRDPGQLYARPRVDRDARTKLLAGLRAALEPFDLIGLTDPLRCNWHPVNAQALLRAAPKLGLNETEVRRLLQPTVG